MNTTALDEAALKQCLLDLPRWHHNPCIPALEAVFHFSDESRCHEYLETLAARADEINHHPQILQAGHSVTLRWWTHSEHAITGQDIQAARLSEQLAETFL